MTFQIENGVQLMVRLNPRPSLQNVFPELFKDVGPVCNSVIEVTGNSGTGKTTYLMELIVRTILPETYNSTTINGKCTHAVFIDSDHHFDMFRLISMIETKLTNLKLRKDDIKSVILESLNRLTICNVFNYTELMATLQKVGELVHAKPQIGLVCLDSISSFYWSMRDFSDEMLPKDKFKMNVLKVVLNHLSDYKIVFAYTKHIGFRSKKVFTDLEVDSKISCKYTIELRLELEQNEYVATVLYNDQMYQVKYNLGLDINFIV